MLTEHMEQQNRGCFSLRSWGGGGGRKRRRALLFRVVKIFVEINVV